MKLYNYITRQRKSKKKTNEDKKTIRDKAEEN